MTDMNMILPLTKSHIYAIGLVTAYFSLLEQDANVLVADLLGLKSRDDIISVTAPMTFSTKVQLIKTLASTRFENEMELSGALVEIIGSMEKANVKRNLIVHASWYYYSPSENKSGILRQKAGGKIKTSLEGFTPEDINDVAKSILETHGKVQHF